MEITLAHPPPLLGAGAGRSLCSSRWLLLALAIIALLNDIFSLHSYSISHGISQNAPSNGLLSYPYSQLAVFPPSPQSAPPNHLASFPHPFQEIPPNHLLGFPPPSTPPQSTPSNYPASFPPPSSGGSPLVLDIWAASNARGPPHQLHGGKLDLPTNGKHPHPPPANSGGDAPLPHTGRSGTLNDPSHTRHYTVKEVVVANSLVLTPQVVQSILFNIGGGAEASGEAEIDGGSPSFHLPPCKEKRGQISSKNPSIEGTRNPSFKEGESSFFPHTHTPSHPLHPRKALTITPSSHADLSCHTHNSLPNKHPLDEMKMGNTHDSSGLKRLVNELNHWYKRNGYVFSRILPEKTAIVYSRDEDTCTVILSCLEPKMRREKPLQLHLLNKDSAFFDDLAKQLEDRGPKLNHGEKNSLNEAKKAVSLDGAWHCSGNLDSEDVGIGGGGGGGGSLGGRKGEEQAFVIAVKSAKSSSDEGDQRSSIEDQPGSLKIFEANSSSLIVDLLKRVDEDVESLAKTDENLISKAMQLKGGEIFRWNANHWNCIVESGVFEEIELFGSLNEKGEVYLDVVAIEAPSLNVEPGINKGLGILKDLHLELSVEDSNLLGKAKLLKATVNRSISLNKPPHYGLRLKYLSDRFSLKGLGSLFKASFSREYEHIPQKEETKKEGGQLSSEKVDERGGKTFFLHEGYPGMCESSSLESCDVGDRQGSSLEGEVPGEESSVGPSSPSSPSSSPPYSSFPSPSPSPSSPISPSPLPSASTSPPSSSSQHLEEQGNAGNLKETEHSQKLRSSSFEGAKRGDETLEDDSMNATHTQEATMLNPLNYVAKSPLKVLAHSFPPDAALTTHGSLSWSSPSSNPGVLSFTASLLRKEKQSLVRAAPLYEGENLVGVCDGAHGDEIRETRNLESGEAGIAGVGDTHASGNIHEGGDSDTGSNTCTKNNAQTHPATHPHLPLALDNIGTKEPTNLSDEEDKLPSSMTMEAERRESSKPSSLKSEAPYSLKEVKKEGLTPSTHTTTEDLWKLDSELDLRESTPFPKLHLKSTLGLYKLSKEADAEPLSLLPSLSSLKRSFLLGSSLASLSKLMQNSISYTHATTLQFKDSTEDSTQKHTLSLLKMPISPLLYDLLSKGLSTATLYHKLSLMLQSTVKFKERAPRAPHTRESFHKEDEDGRLGNSQFFTKRDSSESTDMHGSGNAHTSGIQGEASLQPIKSKSRADLLGSKVKADGILSSCVRILRTGGYRCTHEVSAIFFPLILLHDLVSTRVKESSSSRVQADDRVKMAAKVSNPHTSESAHKPRDTSSMNAPPSLAIPEGEKLLVGGPSSLRGFTKKGLGPYDAFFRSVNEVFWPISINDRFALGQFLKPEVLLFFDYNAGVYGTTRLTHHKGFAKNALSKRMKAGKKTDFLGVEDATHKGDLPTTTEEGGELTLSLSALRQLLKRGIFWVGRGVDLLPPVEQVGAIGVGLKLRSLGFYLAYPLGSEGARLQMNLESIF